MRTLVISPSHAPDLSDRVGERLRARRGFAAPEFARLDDTEDELRRHGAELVVVCLARECATATFDLLRRLRDVTPAHLLTVGPADDAKLILRAVQAGASLFIDENELNELDAALIRLHPVGATAGPEVLAVLGAAGGCGASTVAVNLAALLARHRGRCNLVDLNTANPDLAPLLDLKPQYTAADLCRNEDRLDRTLYEKLLTAHDSGVALLAGASRYADAPLTVGGLELALGLAREAFSNVVIDLGACFGAEQAVALEHATRVLLVTRLDFVAVRNTRRVIDHLTARGVPRERIEVVVNHAGLPNQLPPADAEVALGVALPHLLPHDPETAGWSANTGIPAAIKDPTGPLVQAIARVVGLGAPAPVAPPWWERARALVRDRVAPWVRALRQRLYPPTPSILDAPPAAETKVCYEPNPAVTRDPADSRSCAV